MTNGNDFGIPPGHWSAHSGLISDSPSDVSVFVGLFVRMRFRADAIRCSFGLVWPDTQQHQKEHSEQDRYFQIMVNMPHGTQRILFIPVQLLQAKIHAKDGS